MNASGEDKLSSVTRAIDVMYMVMQYGSNPFTLTAIMRKSGLPKGTTHRYLAALQNRGMIEQGEDTLTYRLAPKLKNLMLAQGLHLIQRKNQEETA